MHSTGSVIWGNFDMVFRAEYAWISLEDFQKRFISFVRGAHSPNLVGILDVGG